MELGLDVAPTLVDVELAADLAVVLQREEQLIRAHHPHRAVLLDVAGVDRPGTLTPDMKHGLVDIIREHQGERLEPLDDLMHVFQHAGHGLMLVHDPIEPEAPDGAAAQGGQQQPAQGVAESVAEAAFERLEPELRGVGVVVPLRHLDDMGTYESGEIDCHGHFEYSSTMSCS